MSRASNKKIIVVSNSTAGKLVETTPRNDKDCFVWDQTKNCYVHEPRALVNHDHEIGNQVLLFENQLI